MIPSVESYKKRKFIGDVMRVRNRANKEYLKSFEEKWGKISNNYRTFMHYLLKYKYTDNWDREVNENYLPISLETLYTKIPSGYRIKYQDNYILPILQQQVKKDFDIIIDHTTHTKIIIENRSFRKYNKMNESKSHYDDINFIEDIFLEYIDKYKMKHGKYLSDPSLQGENFDDNYPLWYTIYPSFNSKISRLYVPSDYYIELSIEAREWKGDIDKDSLFKDIDHFLNRIEKYGWKWVESSTCNKRTFLNKNTKVGESYSTSLRYYLYKNNKVNESNTNQLKQLTYDEYEQFNDRKLDTISEKEYNFISNIFKEKIRPIHSYNRSKYIELIGGDDDEFQAIIHKYDDEWFTISVSMYGSTDKFYLSDEIDGIKEIKI